MLTLNYRLILCAVWLIVFPSVALAQDDAPAIDGITLSQGDFTLQLPAPPQWESILAGDPIYYGLLTNREQVRVGEVAVDIQVILTDADALSDVLRDPIDTESANPALDYMQRYAETASYQQRGVYLDPITIDTGNYPAAMMLYIEETDRLRFDDPAALSLAIALYLDDDNFAIVLADGAASNGQLIFTQWVNTLRLLTIDGETPPFLPELRQTLLSFTPPEQLVLEFTNRLALSPDAVLLVDDISYRPPVDWEQTSVEDNVVIYQLEDAQLSIRVAPRDTTRLLQQQLADFVPDGYFVDDVTPFEWGRNAFPAIAASLDSMYTEGNIVIVDLEDRVVVSRYEAQDNPESRTDWLAVLQSLTLEGRFLDPDGLQLNILQGSSSTPN